MLVFLGSDCNACFFYCVRVAGDPTALITSLSSFVHDKWARTRLDTGWRHGKKKSVSEKRHPNLLPLPLLPKDARDNVTVTVTDTLKTIIALGYFIGRSNHAGGVLNVFSAHLQITIDFCDNDIIPV